MFFCCALFLVIGSKLEVVLTKNVAIVLDKFPHALVVCGLVQELSSETRVWHCHVKCCFANHCESFFVNLINHCCETRFTFFFVFLTLFLNFAYELILIRAKASSCVIVKHNLLGGFIENYDTFFEVIKELRITTPQYFGIDKEKPELG